MSRRFELGALFLHQKFIFPDGGDRSPKYCLVIGAKDGHDYICVPATSQERRREFNFEYGCNNSVPHKANFFIPTERKLFFNVNTWFEFRLTTRYSEPIVNAILNRNVAKDLKYKFPEGVMERIIECAQTCNIVSPKLKQVMGD